MLLCLGFLCLAGPVIAASLDEPIPLQVRAQPLGESLRNLAKQANLQILFDPALVAGRSAESVEGTLTARTALDRLLRGTGLEAREQAPGVVVIRRKGVSDAQTHEGFVRS